MPDYIWILVFVALGIVVGFAAGLLGVGGGGIMVPVFTSIFAAQGFPAEHLVHAALATSLAAIILTSLSSMRAHHSHEAVLWPVFWKLSPGIVIGTFSASFLASQIPTKPLALFFAAFMAYVSLQMALNIKPKPSRNLPDSAVLGAAGVGIGAVSALVAIGGGSLTVPFLTWCNVPIKKAIGTSAAVGLPIALTGTAGYLTGGWSSEGLPPLSLGFIYLPAAVFVSAASFFTAPLGAKLAHSLPVASLKRVFALLLFSLSVKMIHTVFGA